MSGSGRHDFHRPLPHGSVPFAEQQVSHSRTQRSCSPRARVERHDRSRSPRARVEPRDRLRTAPGDDVASGSSAAPSFLARLRSSRVPEDGQFSGMNLRRTNGDDVSVHSSNAFFHGRVAPANRLTNAGDAGCNSSARVIAVPVNEDEASVHPHAEASFAVDVRSEDVAVLEGMGFSTDKILPVLRMFPDNIAAAANYLAEHQA